jgi:hypothetical protein
VLWRENPSAHGCAQGTTASRHLLDATAKRICMGKDEKFNDVLVKELEKFKANIKTVVRDDEEFFERARRENLSVAVEPVNVPPLPGDRDE